MEIVVLVVVAAVVTVLGIRVGMLLAPRVERWGTPPEPPDEDPSADDRR
jgi:hypothetical protein